MTYSRITTIPMIPMATALLLLPLFPLGFLEGQTWCDVRVKTYSNGWPLSPSVVTSMFFSDSSQIRLILVFLYKIKKNYNKTNTILSVSKSIIMKRYYPQSGSPVSVCVRKSKIYRKTVCLYQQQNSSDSVSSQLSNWS